MQQCVSTVGRNLDQKLKTELSVMMNLVKGRRSEKGQEYGICEVKESCMDVIKVDQCSMCGKTTAKVVAGHYLCPTCCEMNGASFVFGAKAMERFLCYSRLAKLWTQRLLKSFWW